MASCNGEVDDVEMETEEDNASQALDDESGSKLCRLCGKLELQIVDLFGEYSTQRDLVHKIETRLSILIDESDPLPKAICIQCVGKLEFVCDFQEECLLIQNVLHDQYNLPSLNVDEQKPEESIISIPSTSTIAENNNIISLIENAEIIISNESIVEHCISNLNNNNICDKNLNPPENDTNLDETSCAKVSPKTRNLRSQLTKTDVKNETLDVQIEFENDENLLASIQQPEITTTTRKLRSSLSTESSDADVNVSKTKRASIKNKRLRSHNGSVDSTTNSNESSNANQIVGEINNQEDYINKIQIPTNTLNKVLSAITNTPGIGVAVKEPTSRSSDVEDISFTVELSKKQETDSLTVLAKVFPNQGSCLVDESIVTFLEEGTTDEVNTLVNNIVNPAASRDNSRSLIDKLQNAEDISNNSLNPEELYKMDGLEIHVDDNVEQIHVNNQVSYACKICRKVYERKDKCIVHVKTHLGIKQYMCILCQARFVCKSDVMKHIRCSHTNPRPIACSKCPKRFRSKFDLAEHMNVHKGIKPYQCADCDQSYHHKVSLQMHVKSHMPPQNLACEYCGKVFPYRTRLLSHIGSVHMKDKRNFRCRFCYNLYSSLTVLNEHIKTRHTTTYTCETCTKTFKVASKYKTHVLQHSNPKPFGCNICKNRYASKAFLNEHLLKHQGVRKHVCPKCNASFAQASHLAAHRHVHGEKSYPCPECGKLFNRRDNMKVHRRRHFMSIEKKTNVKQRIGSNDENVIDANEN
ncbi:zinc finger protein 354A-like [Copidosoma floridanum]|uniref:zinc finger protein 354A-like n=1 Tax=Copidosoma floridanum TaxID=29053 RepID=UPI0006C976AA|nr:zinc finger protein 354A-like [Copidosoma floridanum]